MSTWTYESLSNSGVAEVDFLFSDTTDFSFSDGADFVFLEGAVQTTWTNPTKNSASYTFETKN